MFDATYVVLGLGDVYLGAPLATPVDPRHRLVTTKYNPARTSTAQNAVGIGGSYLCIYGLEGPGGYQFVGRTVQIWSHYAQRPPFEPGTPWLLRFFDRIRWYPVVRRGAARRTAPTWRPGGSRCASSPGTFKIAEYERLLADNAAGIATFRARQSAAFAEERAAWERAGEFASRDDPETASARPPRRSPPPSGAPSSRHP